MVSIQAWHPGLNKPMSFGGDRVQTVVFQGKSKPPSPEEESGWIRLQKTWLDKILKYIGVSPNDAVGSQPISTPSIQAKTDPAFSDVMDASVFKAPFLVNWNKLFSFRADGIYTFFSDDVAHASSPPEGGSLNQKGDRKRFYALTSGNWGIVRQEGRQSQFYATLSASINFVAQTGHDSVFLTQRLDKAEQAVYCLSGKNTVFQIPRFVIGKDTLYLEGKPQDWQKEIKHLPNFAYVYELYNKSNNTRVVLSRVIPDSAIRFWQTPAEFGEIEREMIFKMMIQTAKSTTPRSR